MGKGRRRRRRSEVAKLSAEFANRSHQRFLSDALSSDRFRTEASRYIRSIVRIEEDILRKTVFVTEIMDLNRQGNLDTLRRFFEQRYGPVISCTVASYAGRRTRRGFNKYPPARVQFLYQRDAESLFGGRELLRVNKAVKIECPVGRRLPNGLHQICVRPSQKYAGMAEGELKASVIDFETLGISLGHWFPCENDLYEFCPDDVEKGGRVDEWLEELTANIKPSFRVDLGRRVVELAYSGHEAGSTSIFDSLSIRNYASFRFKALVHPIELCRDRENPDDYSLVFSLKYPPKLESECLSLGLDLEQPERSRDVKFGNIGSDMFGRCLGFKLRVSEAAVDRLLLNESLGQLKAFGILRRELLSSQQTKMISSRDIQSGRERIDAEMQKIHTHNAKAGLLLRSLLDHGKLCWYHAVTDTVYDESQMVELSLFELIRSRQKAAAISALETMLGAHGKTRYPSRVFRMLLSNDAEDVLERPIPEYCISIPRLRLSPCRQLVEGFEVEMSNRVIRKYVEKGYDPESFLRVHVADEDGRNLFHRELSNPVVAKLKSLVLDGIFVNGRRYHFLAYSSSQLKECAVWMVAGEGQLTVRAIRSGLGDFTSCKTPSKYAARVGQCFSTTVQTSPGDMGTISFSSRRLRVGELEDVNSFEIGREFCHSDGTGLITRQAMNELLARVPFAPTNLSDVSIIQIRFGGAKGTLVAWDFEKLEATKHTRRDVFLRPSMIKFTAPYAQLEVCSVGKHVPYFLNRNVILLLGVHGIPDLTFLNMQRVMLDDLDEMLVCPRKAAEIIPRLGGADSGLKATLLRMIAAGMTPASEPFLLSCLHATRTHQLYGLRKKARISVPKGTVLMGGMDETGLLAECCVFVQLRKQPNGGLFDREIVYEPIVGPVMVTKHPAMHPGDVRMLLAVDIPELRSHRNVILFSRKGSRPETDKMAGSDLDGDEYAITWDSKLFLRQWRGCHQDGRGRYVALQGHSMLSMTDIEHDAKILSLANQEPLDYTGSSSNASRQLGPQASEEEKSKALVDYFFDYAKLDVLGQIGMLWQDYATLHGAHCSECIELAKQHSIAVDFAKSGIPAEIPKELIFPRDKPRAHWREKKLVPSFHCQSIIGQLYDEVTFRSESFSLERARRAVAGRTTDKYGQILSRLKYPGIREYLEEIYDPSIPIRLGLSMGTGDSEESDEMQRIAMNERISFEERVSSLMNAHGLRSEGELFTGCIRKYHKANKRRQYEVSETVRRECREICNEHREYFFQEVLRIVNSDTENGYNGSSLDDSLYHSLYKAFEGMTLDEDKEIHPAQTTTPSSDTDADEYYDQILDWAKKVSTSRILSDEDDSELGWTVRATAFKLAGAYYNATYAPDFRWRKEDENHALFSFPWIVADVLCCGIEAASVLE